MTGETDLSKLIQEMKPEIRQIELVFCTLPWDDIPEATIDPLLLFKEVEGMTIILPKSKALQLGFSFENTWTWIELTVHSSLYAVGFIATVTQALAEAGISVNVVSAFNHDHLFVQDKQAKKAIKVLEELIKKELK